MYPFTHKYLSCNLLIKKSYLSSTLVSRLVTIWYTIWHEYFALEKKDIDD